MGRITLVAATFLLLTALYRASSAISIRESVDYSVLPVLTPGPARLYDCLMVTQITLNTEPMGSIPARDTLTEKVARDGGALDTYPEALAVRIVGGPIEALRSRTAQPPLV